MGAGTRARCSVHGASGAYASSWLEIQMTTPSRESSLREVPLLSAEPDQLVASAMSGTLNDSGTGASLE